MMYGEGGERKKEKLREQARRQRDDEESIKLFSLWLCLDYVISYHKTKEKRTRRKFLIDFIFSFFFSFSMPLNMTLMYKDN